MIIREASIKDWYELSEFFSLVYRYNHPLQNKYFWDWQYGNSSYGRSFIALNDDNQIKGHIGATFGGGIAWIINVNLELSYRGKGILKHMYGLAREYYPLAATAANEAGLGLYRNMRWIRYHDLVRFVKINPTIKVETFEDGCSGFFTNLDSFIVHDTHYFQQPGLKGILLKDGSRAVCQAEVGGLRLVDYNTLNDVEEKAWEYGFRWMDYLTSWNDLRIKDLEKQGWIPDYKSVIPWNLNPLEEGSYCNISFLSEEPLNKEFVVHRSYSDHGRVGSIFKFDS